MAGPSVMGLPFFIKDHFLKIMQPSGRSCGLYHPIQDCRLVIPGLLAALGDNFQGLSARHHRAGHTRPLMPCMPALLMSTVFSPTPARGHYHPSVGPMVTMAALAQRASLIFPFDGTWSGRSCPSPRDCPWTPFLCEESLPMGALPPLL